MKLLDDFPIISDQVDKAELSYILRAVDDVLERQVAGEVIELGCYVGTTSLFLARLLVQHDSSKVLHVYDSFAGLPPKTPQDNSPVGRQFVAGELRASRAELVRNFKRAKLPLPIIHKAWFDDLTARDMPSQIAFAFLDGDFYESIQTSLRLVWPRLSSGSIVVVDDYLSEALPGVRAAVDAWLLYHPASIQTAASLAILRY